MALVVRERLKDAVLRTITAIHDSTDKALEALIAIPVSRMRIIVGICLSIFGLASIFLANIKNDPRYYYILGAVITTGIVLASLLKGVKDEQ